MKCWIANRILRAEDKSDRVCSSCGRKFRSPLQLYSFVLSTLFSSENEKSESEEISSAVFFFRPIEFHWVEKKDSVLTRADTLNFDVQWIKNHISGQKHCFDGKLLQKRLNKQINSTCHSLSKLDRPLSLF